MRLRWLVVLSLLATYGIFFEYLPPRKTVHFFADIDGFHLPLLNHAHHAYREGRVPEWDESIYCGIPFAGNIQAGTFYPPNWILTILNWNRPGLRFWHVEALEILHFWLAFFWAWCWLRGHTSSTLAPVFAGACYGLTGYPLAESQHLGVVCAYAWLPLAMLGVDRVTASGRWQSSWIIAAASALTFLAGYPAAWTAFCVIIAGYAMGRLRLKGLAIVSAAVAFSLLLAAVQLGPTMEASALKQAEDKYLPFIEREPSFYLLYLIPNFHDHSLKRDGFSQMHEEYLYLGSPALFGLLWLMRRRGLAAGWPAWSIFAATLLFMWDPFRWISTMIVYVPMLSQSTSAWNFLPGVSLGVAFLAAVSLDDYFRTRPPQIARSSLIAICLLLVAWPVRLWIFRKSGVGLAIGWWSAAEAALCVLIFGLGSHASRASRVAAALLVLAVGVEYKVYGSARRFDARPGVIDRDFRSDRRVGGPGFLGVDDEVFAEMLRNRHFRVAIEGGPHPTDMRHYGLSTPQGFDPFISIQYHTAVEKFVKFSTNRMFDPPIFDAAFLDQFGIRYVITLDWNETAKKLRADPKFRPVPPAKSFMRVFEYAGARPSFRFDGGTAEPIHWEPERRVFRLTGAAGGRFKLLEQYFPGWEAWADGRPLPIERADETFQAVNVPAGVKELEFRYRCTPLRYGAAISLLALALLVWAARASRSGQQTVPLQ